MLLLGLSLLAGCQEDQMKIKVADKINYKGVQDSVEQNLYQKSVQYEGTLPCADCGGIYTNLTLIQDNSTYLLKETYLDAKPRTYLNVGHYDVEEKHIGDSVATYYALETADDSPRYFMLLNDSLITQLTRNKKRIYSNFYELKKLTIDTTKTSKK